MTTNNDVARGGLSRRGTELLTGSGMPEYLVEHFRRSPERWHPDTNPDGYLGLCVAENALVWDLIEPQVTAPRPVPREALAYDAMIGAEGFRRRLARFLGHRVLGREVEHEQIAVLAGAGSVLEILFHALADPGDGILVPTPSYAGFWLDLETRDGLRVVPVDCASDDGFRLTPQRLETAYRSAGRPVRALLYTNPDNPRGSVATAAETAAILAWAEARELHVVCDEIYALSVFGDRPFVSSANLRSRLGDRHHIVWGFSKDFAASGLRCGVLVSENRALLAAVDALAYWACCSGDTQHLLGALLDDEVWLEHYLAEMPRRLGTAYASVTAALECAQVPYLPAAAGFFLLLDLRRFLTAPTFDAERALWHRLLDVAGINLTPGAACHIAEPGFMRLCFAALPTDAVAAGVQRLAAVLD